ncbi:DUF2975 domain-containing protein [Croceicoccus bisphenolivorans]|uniref:DUF2975 domain-containing protein n=1 Tax=Croceicoccus bisphenolivorans TaxID=1783232 RepID=UPI00082953A0|nr:DUF2975 domain-containing protein [Croceicoccus bisphenolivorans]
MTTFRKDPLLKIASVLLSFIQTVVVIAGVAIVAALPTMLVMKGWVIAEMASDKVPPEAFWGIMGLLALILVSLVMIWFFVRHLRRIVMTVADGDPFVPVNADRLAAMAWLSLGAWVVNIPTQALGSWLESVTEGSSINIGVGEDGTSLAMVLTLFILARVFRKGAEMREDLEGTV